MRVLMVGATGRHAHWVLGEPTKSLRDGMRRMMDHYDKHGLPGGNPLVLRSILGREPRSLKDYFRELLSR